MVYQTMEANHYLEGNVAITLRLLTEALRKLGLDAKQVAERRSRWQAEHKKWRDGIAAAEEKAAAKDVITVPLLMKTLREVMPADTSYVDETIVHAGDIREHILWESRTPTSARRAVWARGWAMRLASSSRCRSARW